MKLAIAQINCVLISAEHGEAVRLTPPIRLTLESAVEFIDDDELVEITPVSIRMRKRYLPEIERKPQLKYPLHM